MQLTRRSFLAVTGASPLLFAGHARTGRTGSIVVQGVPGCLEESASGYVQSVGAAPMSAGSALGQRAATVIVPASAMDRQLAFRLREAAWDGASVLVELGAPFMDAASARTQRRLFADAFELSIGDSVHLWADGRCRVPYVRYRWPVAVWVRDFSRSVTVQGVGWDAIAEMESRPVGVRRRVGRGGITVLGSPLGPSLRAGDQEAVVWVRAFLDGSRVIHASIG